MQNAMKMTANSHELNDATVEAVKTSVSAKRAFTATYQPKPSALDR